MIKLEFKELLNAGVHFGHLTRKWNPKMAPFIFMKENGIHIIDLNKTISCMQDAALQLNAMAQAGKKILFVGTKKQIKASVEQVAKDLGMPYVTERWLGGTLTNFSNTRKLLKRMLTIEKSMHTSAYKNLAKKERLFIAREQEKLNRILQGLANVTRLPSALFVVDIKEEHIAVEEARKLGIPVFALVDTNTNPDKVDFPIPGNDDAFRSVDIVVRSLALSIKDGITAYKKEKAEATAKKEEETAATVNDKIIPKRGIKVVQGVVIKQSPSLKYKTNPTITKPKPVSNSPLNQNHLQKSKVADAATSSKHKSEQAVEPGNPINNQLEEEKNSN